MAAMQLRPDQRSGYCTETKTFYSLRPSVTLPSPSQPLSVTDYAFHLLHSSPATSPSTPFLIDAPSGRIITYSDFLQRCRTLAANLLLSFPSLSKNDVAFILSPTSLEVPLLYFALISIGITVCPANSLATRSELAHMIELTKPVIAFTTSSISSKLPDFPLGTILLDSPDFQSMTTLKRSQQPKIIVEQSDRAALLFSSGTTGRIKGVELSQRNFISVVAGFYHIRREEEEPVHSIALMFIPMFHVFGFFMLFRCAALGETVVVMERFDFEKMLAAVERYKVTYMPVSPPLVVAMAKSDLAGKYDLRSLRLLGSGGAPLGKEVSESFTARFPWIEVVQGYGLTETGGAATRMVDPEETSHFGSVGKLSENLEAKIVDPSTGEALPPNQRGELWLRGPTVMRGYVGDDEATAATLDKDGWLKTGDLCYFDSDGFLYVVDRLKELIKYKAYQVPPAELEHLLQGHPEIADAAVVPYPDEEAGQIPMAFIVRKPESNITATQVMDFIAKQVSPYKKIRRVAFINAIPKSPAGKILRRELANQAVSAASSKL